jgi:hypothetical protein
VNSSIRGWAIPDLGVRPMFAGTLTIAVHGGEESSACSIIVISQVIFLVG